MVEDFVLEVLGVGKGHQKVQKVQLVTKKVILPLWQKRPGKMTFLEKNKPIFGYFPVQKSHFASRFATLKEGGERSEKTLYFRNFYCDIKWSAFLPSWVVHVETKKDVIASPLSSRENRQREHTTSCEKKVF
jgi:hypothetical protein